MIINSVKDSILLLHPVFSGSSSFAENPALHGVFNMKISPRYLIINPIWGNIIAIISILYLLFLGVIQHFRRDRGASRFLSVFWMLLVQWKEHEFGRRTMRKKMQLTRREMEKFEAYLRHDEREPATTEAYLRSLRKFAEWADSRTITKELAAAWKAELLESGYCRCR